MSKLFNYEADHIHDMVHPNLLTDSAHYVAECKDIILTEATPNYPKLTDYESEWLYFYEYVYEGGGDPVDLEYQTLDFVHHAFVNNAIPFNYKRAILKGNTKYRDIDTGDILDTFDETKNLELVSVKVPVLKATGKNLLENIEWEIEKKLLSNGAIGDAIGNNVSPYINVSNLDVITFSGFKKGAHCLYNKDKNIIGERVLSSIMTIDVGGAYYIRVAIDNKKDYSNPQMEVGSVATSYEPYKSNILTTNEEVELRGIGDVKDELDLFTGELIQRVGEVVLDGSEVWSIEGSPNSTSSFGVVNDAEHNTFTSTTISSIVKSRTAYTCDKIKYANFDGSAGFKLSGDMEVISNGGGYNKIFIRTKTTTASTVDELKTWLSQNPLTVQYELKTESVKTVDLSGSFIKPFEGTNHYYTSSDTIPPLCELSVPVESTGAQTIMEINQED